ncbi:hypothetical protein KP509_21G077700 [Ceratopteris richardii]|uniref:Uncharacterized protein n=1 Tax=Ceratopteris richardii TaxID=49495 RepID=A0A8T2SC63_CERRI|nr:hypothetical protein KP509_21G077700 [Ceratopteris richardii]
MLWVAFMNRKSCHKAVSGPSFSDSVYKLLRNIATSCPCALHREESVKMDFDGSTRSTQRSICWARRIRACVLTPNVVRSKRRCCYHGIVSTCANHYYSRPHLPVRQRGFLPWKPDRRFAHHRGTICRDLGTSKGEEACRELSSHKHSTVY